MNRRIWGGILLTAALLAVLAMRAVAADDESLENRPLIHDDAHSSAVNSKSPALQPAGRNFDAMHITLALVAVLGLIFVLRAITRRFMGAAVPHRHSAAVKVLCRCTISPRQHLLLIQFGKRLVLVGDSGASLNPLCEIGDEEEVSAVVGKIREESAAAAHAFDSLFGLARKAFSHSATSEPGAQAESEPAPERFDESHEINDPGIESTQKELSDLSEKVRDLARQIGRA